MCHLPLDLDKLMTWHAGFEWYRRKKLVTVPAILWSIWEACNAACFRNKTPHHLTFELQCRYMTQNWDILQWRIRLLKQVTQFSTQEQDGNLQWRWSRRIDELRYSNFFVCVVCSVVTLTLCNMYALNQHFVCVIQLPSFLSSSRKSSKIGTGKIDTQPSKF